MSSNNNDDRFYQQPNPGQTEDYRHHNNSSTSTAVTVGQRISSQQRHQEERRRHTGQSTNSPTSPSSSSPPVAVAAAGTGVSPWLSKQNQKSTKWKIIAWSLVAVLLVALVAIVTWYFAFFKKNQGGSGSSNSSNGDSGGNGQIAQGPTVITPNGTVVPNDNFPLKRVFYGMAYVPLNAQLPNCYNTQQSVDNELQLLVQATRRVRLYGTDCNVLRYTLDAIQRLKLDLKVIAGLWIDSTDVTYARQRDEFFNVVGTYGWENIIGVSVGNEVLFDKYQPINQLLAHIKEVKDKVVALGHPEIPVFTSDLEASNRPPLTNSEDKAGVNLHPFFAGVPVSDAASWFWNYLQQSVQPAVSTSAKPIDIWITEVGWPTFPANGNMNASIPSIPNLQTFIDTWLCDANTKGIPYYYFEFFDAPWKIWPGSAVEGFWGLLTIDKKLKVSLPDCLAD
ncbi:hypothetical protein BGZ98_001998 [Dissophora globulifera]|nr:hypothetical protein BGZ98_001998 [Dissophora globulifera]